MFGVGRLDLEADARAAQVGVEDASDRGDHAVEEGALQPFVVSEVLEMADVADRTGGVQVQRLRTVPRDLQAVRLGNGTDAHPLADTSAAGDVSLQAVYRSSLAHGPEVEQVVAVFSSSDVDGSKRPDFSQGPQVV